MAEPFVAEIRIFPFNFPPKGWAFCQGQLMAISQNTALFSLLGTYYGGDGKTTFALPNMQGNVALNLGQGPGLTLRDLGEMGGSQAVTLLQSEMPAHPHNIMANDNIGNQPTPDPQICFAKASAGDVYQTTTNTNLTQMAGNIIGPMGGSQPHNNMMPYLTLSYCIALQGIYPQRG
jgi:microcystin-dependent protein